MPTSDAPALTADICGRLREIGCSGLGSHSETAHDAADALDRLSAQLAAALERAETAERERGEARAGAARAVALGLAANDQKNQLEERERHSCTAYRGMLKQAEADLAGARERVKALEEALSEATCLLHRCNGTFVPGNDEANAEIADACRRFAGLLEDKP